MVIGLFYFYFPLLFSTNYKFIPILEQQVKFHKKIHEVYLQFQMRLNMFVYRKEQTTEEKENVFPSPIEIF